MAKNYMPWIIGGALGIGALYLMSQQQAPAARVPAAAAPAAAPQVSGDFIGMGQPGGTQQILIAKAQQELGLPMSGLVVRGLRPEDLGLTTSWSFTSAAVNTWENWINATVADTTFIGIEAVSYAGTSFSQARLTGGARVSGFWDLNFIAGLANQIYYQASPIIIDQNQPVVVDVISNTQPATEFINLIGTVVEKRGLVINP